MAARAMAARMPEVPGTGRNRYLITSCCIYSILHSYYNPTVTVISTRMLVMLVPFAIFLPDWNFWSCLEVNIESITECNKWW